MVFRVNSIIQTNATVMGTKIELGQHVLVLGGGSAGLLASLTLRRMVPGLRVTMVRSREIGVIGVGEGTTAVFPKHLFETLGIPKERFYREAEPTWKQGIRFLWGERGDYFYDFGFQYDLRFEGMEKATGYYAGEDCDDLNVTCAMMRRGRAFQTGPLGKPLIKGEYAFHIENAKLVNCLENLAAEYGVEVLDDTLCGVSAGPDGVGTLHFESGAAMSADWYVDASGFRAELIGRHLEEEFVSFSGGLFCDRAVIGGWHRTDEPLQAYTTAETMDSGWCWMIEHENFINRGYVYGSSFISDEDALEEFLRVNPRVSNTPRVVKFRSGRRRRNWVGNVIAIGNASGFVEPLEATALAQIIFGSGWLAHILKESGGRPSPQDIDRYNLEMGRAWDEIRDFLALHYKFNTLRDTGFWKHCRSETSLGNFQGFFDAYSRIGPSENLVKHLPHVPNIYGIEGFLAHLIGMRVPYQDRHLPSDQEKALWQHHRSRIAARAAASVTAAETLKAIRSDGWRF
jgi:tryptophan halogenase